MNADVAKLEKALTDAQARSIKAMERRMALPPGSTRARVTTANAEWARAAEHRDRCRDHLDAAMAAQSVAPDAVAPMLVGADLPAIVVGDTLELAGRRYSVCHVGKFTISMRGRRGGSAALVQNEKNSTMWALMKGVKSTWLRRQPNGSFEVF